VGNTVDSGGELNKGVLALDKTQRNNNNTGDDNIIMLLYLKYTDYI
jgi:hypothetical protein